MKFGCSALPDHAGGFGKAAKPLDYFKSSVLASLIPISNLAWSQMNLLFLKRLATFNVVNF